MAPGCRVLPGAASQITAQWAWKETQTSAKGSPLPHRPMPPQAAPTPPVKGAPWTPFAG